MKAIRIIGLVLVGVVLLFTPVVAGVVVGFWYQSSKLPPSKPTVVRMKVVYVDPAASGQPAPVDAPQRAP